MGVATSVSVDHATPAAFYAHQPDRNMYYEIATDLPKANFDFYAGAGFLKPTTTADKKKHQASSPCSKKPAILWPVVTTILRQKPRKLKNDSHPGRRRQCILPAICHRPQKDDLTLAQITESAIEFLTKEKTKASS